MSFTNVDKNLMTVNYLVTQAVEFLMTEDDDNLVTDDSRYFKNTDKNSATFTNITK